MPVLVQKQIDFTGHLLSQEFVVSVPSTGFYSKLFTVLKSYEGIPLYWTISKQIYLSTKILYKITKICHCFSQTREILGIRTLSSHYSNTFCIFLQETNTSSCITTIQALLCTTSVDRNSCSSSCTSADPGHSCCMVLRWPSADLKAMNLSANMQSMIPFLQTFNWLISFPKSALQSSYCLDTTQAKIFLSLEKIASLGSYTWTLRSKWNL